MDVGELIFDLNINNIPHHHLRRKDKSSRYCDVLLNPPIIPLIGLYYHSFHFTWPPL